MSSKPIRNNAAADAFDRIATRYGALIIAALALLPPLLVAAFILAFGVNVVNTDQWEFVPLLDKMYNGTLTAGDIFAQHNEHRIVFPKLIMLGLASLTRYNVMAEMFCSWAITLGTAALLFALYRRRSGASPRSLLLFLPAVWLFFSLRQFDNILWGWQIQVYLGIFGFVACLFALDRAGGLDAWLAGAVAGGVLASFSFVNGLLAWPAGLLFIALSRPAGRLKLGVPFALAGLLSFIVYFLGWVYPPNPQSILYTPDPVGNAVQFFLINVGSPVALEKGYALAAGVVLLCLAAALVLFLIRDGALRQNAPWLALMAFSLLCSGAITFGRVRLGLDEALMSRYTSFTLLLALGAYLAAAGLLSKREGQVRPILYGMVLSMVLLGIVSGLIGGVHFGQKLHDTETGWVHVLSGYGLASDDQLAAIYSKADRVRSGAAILERRGLNIFSGG